MPKTVLVTGASSGIGAAVARTLQTRGFTVFGTTREVGPDSPREIPMLVLDVASDDSVRACVDEVVSRTGRLDVLVNNAGYALMGAAEETRVAEAKAQFETNFFGVVRMVNTVLPGMRQAGSGTILNIGSLAGLTAIPFIAFYSATKYALEAYSEALWYECRPFGIAVTLIEPGWVHTGIGHASQIAAEPLTAYDAPRTRAIAAINRAIGEGISSDLVATAVRRALESPRPRLRYRVGTSARWLPRLKNAVPWGMYASAIRRNFDLDAKR
jgi:short-subunit dehydrogenase